jgi:hypothetical protein
MMTSVSLAFPIRLDKVEQARRWGEEKRGSHRADGIESNRRIGMTRESWYLQLTPDGALLIFTGESPDLPAAFASYAASDGEFERWEKHALEELTGVDLDRLLDMPMPETLVDWRES